MSNKHRPLLLCLKNEDDTLFFSSYLLCHDDSYKDVFIALDRTKFERKKHIKLLSEHRNRCSKCETDLIIHKGAIITKPAARSNTASTANKSVPNASNQHS